ncbi:MAG: phosphodiester glycosidase family protein [Chitinophagaceae bacterium]|nr:phosphodiester glycosidase family protein [Chitinophagaceae bacterium]
MASLQKIYFLFLLLQSSNVFAQVKWQNIDSLFQPLPINFHVYKTTDSVDGKPFLAYYAEAKLKDKHLKFTTDTTFKRRLTPQQFFNKNNQPLVVVNGTFFSFETNQNLNIVIKNGKIVSYNVHTIAGKGKDTLTYKHPFGSAIGIDKKRRADVAWIYSDSAKQSAFVLPFEDNLFKDSVNYVSYKNVVNHNEVVSHSGSKKIIKKWKIKTAIGGGPALLQNGEIKITNNEELKFSGKTGLTDKHPRTAMGYTNDGKLIIMVIQGRSADAAGATLVQEAQFLKDLGCVEALNLDGGGSSCMLINGKETIKPSDKTGQRAVPAVFLVQQKK